MINYKKSKSANYLEIHTRLRTIPLRLLLLLTIMFGFTLNGFSDVVIDDNELIQTGGLCAFNIPGNREFEVKLSPINGNADWTLTPSGDTAFVGGSQTENNTTSVNITVGNEAKRYTLTATDGVNSDFITIVVGQSARIVSFIDEISNSDWDEGHPDYDPVNGVVAQIKTEKPTLDLGPIRDSVHSLDLVDNPTPAKSFPDNTAWGDFIGEQQYRGFLYLRPTAIFDSEGQALCSSLINEEDNNGWTPDPGLSSTTLLALGGRHAMSLS